MWVATLGCNPTVQLDLKQPPGFLGPCFSSLVISRTSLIGPVQIKDLLTVHLSSESASVLHPTSMQHLVLQFCSNFWCTALMSGRTLLGIF